jgi:hypothetical protein
MKKDLARNGNETSSLRFSSELCVHKLRELHEHKHIILIKMTTFIATSGG